MHTHTHTHTHVTKSICGSFFFIDGSEHASATKVIPPRRRFKFTFSMIPFALTGSEFTLGGQITTLVWPRPSHEGFVHINDQRLLRNGVIIEAPIDPLKVGCGLAIWDQKRVTFKGFEDPLFLHKVGQKRVPKTGYILVRA